MNEANSRLKPQTGGLSYSVCTIANFLVAVIFVFIIRAAQIDENSDLYKYINYLAAPVAISIGCFGTMKYCKQSFHDVGVISCIF